MSYHNNFVYYKIALSILLFIKGLVRNRTEIPWAIIQNENYIVEKNY